MLLDKVFIYSKKKVFKVHLLFLEFNAYKSFFLKLPHRQLPDTVCEPRLLQKK